MYLVYVYVMGKYGGIIAEIDKWIYNNLHVPCPRLNQEHAQGHVFDYIRISGVRLQDHWSSD